MRTGSRWHWARALALAALVAGCESNARDDDDDGGGGGAGGGQVPEQPLVLDIQSAEVPATGRPTVTFRVAMPDGTAVDLAAEIGSANASPATFPNTVPRFTIAALDENGDYTSLYEATVQPRAYTAPEGITPPEPGPVTQATYQPPPRNASGQAIPWPVGDLESLGNGVYRVTLPETNVTGVDRNRTHTVAGWAVRTTEQGGEQLIGFDSVSFVPGGGTARVEQAVTDASCASCHGFVQAHGTRRGVELCMTCHSPQTADPETQRTQDFKVLIHKIHAGGDLPSVQQGNPYYIVGFNQTVLDFSHVVVPWYRGGTDCAICHNDGDGAGRFATQPTVATCTSCHDNVKFDGSAGKVCGAAGGSWFDDCNHPTPTSDEGPASCRQCHSEDQIRTNHGQQ